jgi:hypothetical protein
MRPDFDPFDSLAMKAVDAISTASHILIQERLSAALAGDSALTGAP